jgi:NADH:ubiquinone oxidoreductase subunit H
MSVLTTVLFCGGWDIIFFFDFFYEILQFFFIKTIKLFYLTINENNIINYLSDYSLYNYNNKHFLEFYYEYNALNFLDLANNFFHKIEKNYFLTMFFVFTIKIIVFIFFFVWTRATYPRYRYNQLMILGWKIFLPLSLGILTLNYSINLIFLL